MGWGAAKGVEHPGWENLTERTAGIQQRLPGALGKVMADMSRSHGLSIQNEVTARAQEVIQTIFKNNPSRIAHDLKRIDVGRATDDEIAVVIANLFASLMVADAAYEGRREIGISDVYLALADFEKTRSWY